MFVVESPFSERDRMRFGVDEMEKEFEVYVLDLTPVVSPLAWQDYGHIQCDWPRITNLHLASALEATVESLNPTFVVSALGRHSFRSRLLRSTKRINAMSAEFWLGVIPEDDLIQRRTLQSLIFRLKRQRLSWLVPVQVLRKLRSLLVPNRTDPVAPDVFFFAGAAALELSDYGAARAEAVHSFDYELARRVPPSSRFPIDGGAIYLDQDIGFHFDLVKGSYRSPADPYEFHRELRHFLTRFSDLTSLEVTVALHPRAAPENVSSRLGSIPISKEPTCSEVARSQVVLGHVSTAVSFAVIFYKPIVFLTGKSLRNGWYGTLIDDLAHRLKSPIVDMSTCGREELVSAINHPVDRDAYDRYKTRYITTTKLEETLWLHIGRRMVQLREGQ